jgi:hypothetical protein
MDNPRDREAIDDRPIDVSIFWNIAATTTTEERTV